MEFRVLGWLEVRRDGASVELSGARARSLLVALLVDAGSVVAVDRLAHLLWGDDPPGDPRNAVQTAVARLRDRLEDPDVVETRNPGYLIDVGPESLDSLRFEALVDEATREREDPATVRRLLADALGLWRGPAYAGFDDGVARAEALRLEERRLAATEHLAEARLRLGETDAVVADLEAETARQPLRERLVELQMEALARADRAADALAVHRAYRRRLADETGLEPSRSVQELEGRILRGEIAEPARRPNAPAPPGRARLPSGSGTLPVVSTSLIGRAEDEARVREALAHRRVVTVTGVGGVGKTRLAAEIATSLGGDGDREVAWVELGAVDDPATVVHVVAEATGVELDGARPPWRELLDALHARSLLLVVDNAEHLLDPVADLVTELVRRCPAIEVLVTSRERLAVPDEQVLALAPLATTPEPGGETSAAVELFRSRAARAGIDIAAGQERVVAELCEELEGLPLAIELAAARTAALPPSQLLDVLRSDGTRSLGERRGRPDRHRDLWAVADWSYQLLPEDERILFERLGIFAGSFTVAAAHAVCAPGGWTESTTMLHLATLVEGSLVSRVPGATDPASGHRLLRPLRELARQRSADRGDLSNLVSRYVDHVTAQVEQAAGPPLRSRGQRRILGSLDDVREVGRRTRRTDDVDALGRLVTALFRFEYLRRGVEFLGWTDDLVRRGRLDESPHAPQLHAAAAVAAWRGGDLQRADEVARVGTELGRGGDDPARRFAFEARGDVATFEGRLADAADHFDEAVRLARIGDDPDTEALGLSSMALVCAYGGDVGGALSRVDEAEAVAAAGEGVRAFVRYARGECLADEEPDRAIVLVEEAAELARSAEAWFVDGVARVTSASLRARHGEPFDAFPVFADLVTHWRRSGSWPQQWVTLRNLAELLVRVGDDEAAVVVASAVRAHQADDAIYGPESGRLDQAMSIAKDRLGTARFRSARAQGASMTRQQVVDGALAVTARPRGTPRPGCREP